MQHYQIWQCCPVDDFGAIGCDRLQGSGRVQAIVQADIAMVEMATSLYLAAHVMRTRKAHQITVTALCILQRHAYPHYTLTSEQNGQPSIDLEASGPENMVGKLANSPHHFLKKNRCERL